MRQIINPQDQAKKTFQVSKHPNAITFDKGSSNNAVLYVGDSSGQIHFWSVAVTNTSVRFMNQSH